MEGLVIRRLGALSGCPCAGKTGWDLVACLAPPPGEHEVSYVIGRDVEVVIHPDGFKLRQLRHPGILPYITTIERRVDPSVLEKAGVKPSEALCRAIEGLEAAARSGSQAARVKLEACRGLVEAIAKACGEDAG
ncbi:MAG: hypothetical protein GSR80_001578 [Desulfurococcales archaeon]|nr:hypothetical protein [Desulfurococcales archaeon]